MNPRRDKNNHLLWRKPVGPLLLLAKREKVVMYLGFRVLNHFIIGGDSYEVDSSLFWGKDEGFVVVVDLFVPVVLF